MYSTVTLILESVKRKKKILFLMQANEPAETKKRKGAVKDDGKKLKKQKNNREKEAGLTLNAAVKCVEILHIKVLNITEIYKMCKVNLFSVQFLYLT